MGRFQRIALPATFGIVFMLILLVAGFFLFGNGPLWPIWFYVSAGFGLWVAFSVYAACRPQDATLDGLH